MEYAKELGKFCKQHKPKVSSRKEWVEIIERAASGCVNAKTQLLAFHGRLIIQKAIQASKRTGRNYEDLIHIGVESMFSNLNKYDASKGSFITFLYYCLQKDFDSTNWKNNMVSCSHDQYVKATQIYREMNDSNTTDIKVISKNLRITEDKVVECMGAYAATCDIDSVDPVSCNSIPPDTLVVVGEIKPKINWILSILTEQEREIIMSFFGMDDEREGLKEIALRLGIPYKDVRNIKRNALKKLEKQMRPEDKEYLHYIS